jgi:P-type E1-E2 ATPase
LLIGLSVLVVACPCAVGLAAPLATSIGIGRLARCGCLVRDPAALEALARTRLLAFDKTGTLTAGRARVVGIESDGAATDEVLARAAGLERHSEHGLAHAICMAAATRGLEAVVACEVRTVPGRGIQGIANGQRVAAGTSALMSDLGWPLPQVLAELARSMEASGHSVVYVGWGERVHGVLSFDDTPLAEARSTIEALRRRGLHVTLLTGDLAQAAQRVAAAVGVGGGDIQAGLGSVPSRRRTGGDGWRRA